jgi:polyhydroxybutyrate depolymerase
LGTQDAGNPLRFTGNVSKVNTGIPFSRISGPNPTAATSIGTFILNFTNGERGTFTHTIPGATNRVLNIERFAIAGGNTNLCSTTGTESPAGTLTGETILSSGLERNYLLYTPANLPLGTVPLVVVLHGGSQDAAITASEALPTYVWRTIADREKIIIAFPNGLINQWNDCRSDKTNRTTADDSAFISGVIDKVSSQLNIDASRVYVTGASNGGMMAYRAALDLGQKIAGVGAVIANMPVDPLRVCPTTPPNPMSIVIMNGTGDPLMPFGGGGVAMSSTSGTVQSATASRDYWVAANGCNTKPVIDNLPDINVSDGVTTMRETYSGCKGNHRAVFFRSEGGGHTTPSLRYFTSGKQSRDFEGTEEIWKVLREARRN